MTDFYPVVSPLLKANSSVESILTVSVCESKTSSPSFGGYVGWTLGNSVLEGRGQPRRGRAAEASPSRQAVTECSVNNGRTTDVLWIAVVCDNLNRLGIQRW